MSAAGRLVIHNRALTGTPPGAAVYARIERKAIERGQRRRADVVERGPELWAEMHRRALAAPSGAEDGAWLEALRRRLPCGECRQHWDAMMEATPPPAAPDLFAWSVARHNEVNRRLGKPEMGLEEALQRWANGLADAVQGPV